MRLFWRHGYEGVSLNDLTSAIGIAPPSLYAAFGSKAGLYLEALDHYSGLPGAVADLGVPDTLDEAIETILRKGALAVTDPSGERGCMISSGMLQSAADHAELAEELVIRRGRMRDVIADALGRWVDRERAISLARYLVVVLQGLSVQARDGATRSELEEVVRQAVEGVRASLRMKGLQSSSSSRQTASLAEDLRNEEDRINTNWSLRRSIDQET
jgi:AcrR family transcriptional regulator